MNLPAWKSLPFAAKAALGAGGALLVAGGAVGATLAVTGAQAGGAAAAPPAVSAPPAPAATPAPAAAGAGRGAARVVLLAGEAQVLGITPKQLAADLKQGQTLQQLAGQKGLTEQQFAAQLAADLKPLLDRAVANQTITADQEQKALDQLARGVPNWAGAPAQ